MIPCCFFEMVVHEEKSSSSCTLFAFPGSSAYLTPSSDSEIHLFTMVRILIHNHYKPCKYLVMFKNEASVKDETSLNC